MRFPTVHVARRRNAFLVLGLVVLLVGAIFAAPAPDKVAPLVSSGLPASYQSAEAELRQQSLPSDGVAPAIVVFSSTDGSRSRRTARPRSPRGPPSWRPSPSAAGRRRRSTRRTAPSPWSPCRSTTDDAAVGREGHRAAHGGGGRPARRPHRPGDRRPGDPGRPRGGLRRREHPAAGRHRVRRRDPAGHHLPQPVPLAGAAHRRRGRRPAGRRARHAHPRRARRALGRVRRSASWRCWSSVPAPTTRCC